MGSVTRFKADRFWLVFIVIRYLNEGDNGCILWKKVSIRWGGGIKLVNDDVIKWIGSLVEINKMKFNRDL